MSPIMTPALTVVFSSEDLWCYVVGRSTESTGGVTWSDPLLRGERTRSVKMRAVVGIVVWKKWRVKKKERFSSQYWSTALLITLCQTSIRSTEKKINMSLSLPCTCHSLWAWCVPRGPGERCPASGHGRWFLFRAGSSERYKFQQHKIWREKEEKRLCLCFLCVISVSDWSAKEILILHIHFAFWMFHEPSSNFCPYNKNKMSHDVLVYKDVAEHVHVPKTVVLNLIPWSLL